MLRKDIDATKPVYCVTCGKVILNTKDICQECGSSDFTNIKKNTTAKFSFALSTNISIILFTVGIIFFFINFSISILSFIISFVTMIYANINYPNEFKELTKNTPNSNFVNTNHPNKIKIIHIDGVNLADVQQKIYCSIDNDSLKFLDKDENIMEEIKYLDIKNISILEEKERTQKKKSVVGRAIVGGLLLGPVAAVVGGISGACPSFKDNKKYYIEISLPDNYYDNIVITAENNKLKKIKESIVMRMK